MGALAGRLDVGLAWLGQFVGQWRYDHAAAELTRFGPMVAGQRWPSRSTVKIGDCSGVLTRMAVEGGMPRGYRGIPESSGSMDRWADAPAQRDLLLWSKHGGGRYASLAEALAHAPRGAFCGIGDYQNGDSGHIVALWDEPRGSAARVTIESASSLDGLKHGNTSRFGGAHAITHVYMPPMLTGPAPAPDPPKPPPAVDTKGLYMDTLFYAVDGFDHAWWIDGKGHLQHLTPWGVENMSTKYAPSWATLDPTRGVSVDLDPTALGRIHATVVSTDGWIARLTYNLGKTWAPMALAPAA